MRLRSVHVRGYRSLRDVEVPLTGLTSLIGPNGSGKSSLLGAIRLFFEAGSSVDELDFWCGTDDDVKSEVISIQVTWSGLTADEEEQFEDYLDGEAVLRVERRFEGAGSGDYLAARRAVPAFTTIRRLQRAHREEYDRLRESGDFEGLPDVRNKDEVFTAMSAWEREHPDACAVSDEPFDELAVLLDSVTFLGIGAFEDPAAHLDAGGSGAVSRLIERVVDQSAVLAELESVATDASTRSAEILQAAAEDLEAVGESMAEMIESFSPGCRVKLDWDPVTLRSPRPRLKVDIATADGLVRPLEYQGHGVQRSLMYAALTADVQNEEAADGTVVLVIEEPEAFQHPLSCRVLARTLRTLSGRDYQVVYSTHSSDFVHADIVDGLRIVRRDDRDGDGPSTHIEALDKEHLLDEWQRVFQGDGYTVASVQARLEAHLSPSVLEGLFARCCVLVEGDEDEALVRGAAAQRGLELDAAGVAVIQTNGKTGMPNVLAFLSLSGIHCYPVFDLDRSRENEADQHRHAEDEILRSLGLDAPVEPGVHETHACWEDNFGKAFEADLGPAYEELLAEAAARFGYPRPRQAKKVPVVIAEVLRGAADAGIGSPSLSALADQLEDLADVSR